MFIAYPEQFYELVVFIFPWCLLIFVGASAWLFFSLVNEAEVEVAAYDNCIIMLAQFTEDPPLRG